jgi:prepilin-type N-terminal cleavage/methylation domain-containing protein
MASVRKLASWRIGGSIRVPLSNTETGRRARPRKAVERVFQRYRDIMERRKSSEGSESGFTLIELLIVIVVLGILAAIVVFSLSGVTGQSKAAACTADGKTIETAADAYEASFSSWPGTNAADPTGTFYGLVSTYLHSAPSGNGYTFTLGTADQSVMVDTGNGTAAAYVTACKGL